MSETVVPKKLYKQEAKTGLYQSMLWCIAMTKPMLRYVPYNYGEVFALFKNNYAEIFEYEENFKKAAEAVLAASPDDLPKAWQEVWSSVGDELETSAREFAYKDPTALNLEQLKELYERFFYLNQEMWAVSIFIDTFDPGFDQIEISRIAQKIGLTDEEVRLLTDASVPSYITEWHRALDELRAGAITAGELHRRFFWYRINYTDFAELDAEFIAAEQQKAHGAEFHSPLQREREILMQRGLAHNPLQLFRTLIEWRDKRKKLDWISLYALLKIMREVSRRQGIDLSLVNGMLPSQVSALFAGELSVAMLKMQLEEGVLVHATPAGELEYSFGAGAQESFGKIISQYGQIAEVREMKGTVASKGKATGRARVIINVDSIEAKEMQAGEVLVTSMTRPEFLPFMRLCAAIVTNEGGITSHAAIVSRELKKPCIIGVRAATDSIKTGDLVEVDAEKGVVKILKRAA
jgi:phosphohistidine swiveling domain-containing protein